MYCGSIAVPLTLLCVVAGGWLTGVVSGDHAGLRDIGADYLVARGPTLLLLVPFSLIAATFNAYKRPRYAVMAGVATNLANLLLDGLLIYGPGPMPRLGAVGNGLATTLSWLLGLGLLLAAARRFGLADLLRRPGPGTPVDFVTSVPKLSGPAIVSSALDYAGMAVFFAIVGGISAAALGGGRIAFQVMVLLYTLGTAFSSAIRILMGRSAGAGRLDEIGAFWRASRYVLLVPGLVLGAVLLLFPRWVALSFTSFAPVLDAAAEALPLIGLSIPLIGWTLGNVSVLRALGQTRSDMYSNLVGALVIQLPLAWLLVDVADLGVAGAYIGVLGYWLVRGFLSQALAHKAISAEHRNEIKP